MSNTAAAETAVARTKVKQALAACRTAAQRLAQTQDIDVIGQRTCATDHDAQAALAVIQLAISEHGQVDVVVLATPKQ